MTHALILGAGGHAQVIADILLQDQSTQETYLPVGFLDDDPTLKDTTILSLPVLGEIAQLEEINHDAIIVAIGDNHTRSQIFDSLQDRGERIINAIHPSAVLAPDVNLGKGAMICAGVVINTGTTIGNNVILNTGCTVDHHNQIGDHAHIAPGVHLGGDVTIGAGTLVGIGATVIPQRTVGAWSIVGAGSVATNDIPYHATAVGVPARVIRQSNRSA